MEDSEDSEDSDDMMSCMLMAAVVAGSFVVSQATPALIGLARFSEMLPI
jgi:hypothetical protein